MSKFKLVIQMIKQQGLKYVAYRIYYETIMKSGLLKLKFPSTPTTEEPIGLEEWKELKIPFLYPSSENISIPILKSQELSNRKERILNGEIQYFNHNWIQVSDWLVNPDNGYRYSIEDHWTLIKDIDKSAGDIKYVWEKSRFTYLLDIMRYDYHFDDDHSEFVFSEIEDWISSNPINMGPNYKCSQEISIRLFNWIPILYFYQNKKALTNDRWQKIVSSIHLQIKHVYSNINFSKICVRNNHAISECLLLYVSGLLFPFMDESAKWKVDGKKWMEQEINYQIYEDGTYLQYSHNYQRVLIQLLTWFVSLSKIHNERISSTSNERIMANLKYMSRCCIGKVGEMPNYGNNDGALFFRLNNQPYTDFRPQINALYKVVYGDFLFDEDYLKEDGYWFDYNLESGVSTIDENIENSELESFEQGGIYTIDDDSDFSFTFFKCGKYKDRPCQADNMHIDIWVSGVNYVRDSGTYKYNTDSELINYFAGTRGHNTIIIENHNQMTKGPRFVWNDWTVIADGEVVETEGRYMIKAKAEMFYSLGQPIQHYRDVTKKPELVWEINDRVENKQDGLRMKQLWHLNPCTIDYIKISSRDELGNDIIANKTTGYWSDHYGRKEEVPLWIFETTTNKIFTQIQILNSK